MECMHVCRCYEVRCSTGAVVGNLTANGQPILFDTRNGFSEPGLNLATVEDDYGRTYAGNPLRSQNRLFTQCFNNTLVSFLNNIRLCVYRDYPDMHWLSGRCLCPILSARSSPGSLPVFDHKCCAGSDYSSQQHICEGHG